MRPIRRLGSCIRGERESEPNDPSLVRVDFLDAPGSVAGARGSTAMIAVRASRRHVHMVVKPPYLDPRVMVVAGHRRLPQAIKPSGIFDAQTRKLGAVSPESGAERGAFAGDSCHAARAERGGRS